MARTITPVTATSASWKVDGAGVTDDARPNLDQL